MPMAKEWHEAFEEIRPYVVGIETKSGRGTGFCCARIPEYDFVCIATAAHVIDSAVSWEEPIKLSFEHGQAAPVVLQPRVDWFQEMDRASDSAMIILPRGSTVPLPQADEQLERLASTSRMRVGVEVAWVGYPSVHHELCFFSGRVSAYDENRAAYLLDGTSIPGVSGGPVFLPGVGKSPPKLIGSITGYTSPGGTTPTPGLCLATSFYKSEEIEQRIHEILSQQAAESEEAPR